MRKGAQINHIQKGQFIRGSAVAPKRAGSAGNKGIPLSKGGTPTSKIKGVPLRVP